MLLRAVSLRIGVVIMAAVHGAMASAAVWDLADDFSPQSNPGGPWSYGYATTLGGPMALYTDAGATFGANYWRHTAAPSVVHNPTANTIVFGTPVAEPGQIVMHPGSGGELSIARLTFPQDGRYYLDTAFFGADTVGATTDVHIMLNNQSIFDGAVGGYGRMSGPAVASHVVVHANDTIDFVVGFGPGGYYYDSTAVEARLHSVLIGDLNYDRIVNIADLSRLASAFGMSSGAAWEDGDFDGDEAVGIRDLSMLAAAFGDQATGDAASTAIIPEPGSILTLGAMTAGLLRRRRRVRSASNNQCRFWTVRLPAAYR